MIMMTHFLFIFVGKVVLLRFLSLCVILWCRPAPRVKYVMVHQGRRGGGENIEGVLRRGNGSGVEVWYSERR